MANPPPICPFPFRPCFFPPPLAASLGLQPCRGQHVFFSTLSTLFPPLLLFPPFPSLSSILCLCHGRREREKIFFFPFPIFLPLLVSLLTDWQRSKKAPLLTPLPSSFCSFFLHPYPQEKTFRHRLEENPPLFLPPLPSRFSLLFAIRGCIAE